MCVYQHCACRRAGLVHARACSNVRRIRGHQGPGLQVLGFREGFKGAAARESSNKRDALINGRQVGTRLGQITSLMD